MVLKVLFAFLLGFIVGAIGTGFLVTSGAGNYLIEANPRVKELESKIREAEDQRAFVTRRLEEVAHLTERMAARFEELQDRFQALERGRTEPAVSSAPLSTPTASPRREDAGAGAPTGP